ncbi:hypothetical protein PIB30_011890 [Stylosanthes scabra]|uniref:Uncharacterized protein n=1 Tax=Stylosanthes scabra TaxID=79078 RepID=A0ABU6V8H3_9FABA|nr:hypothetical protein [Stylosanthes scabra]
MKRRNPSMANASNDEFEGHGHMRKPNDAGETTLRSGGPLWIAQLWMNAVFEKFMVLNRSYVPIKLPIEGYRLAHLEPNFNVKGKEVIDYFCRVKKEGKTEAQLIVDKHWSNYLAVQVLPIGFPGYKKDRYKIVLHSPHFMARQMGFSQAIPAPYSTDPTQQICHFQYNRSLDEIVPGINRKKEQLKENEKVAQEEQATQKRKAESAATKKTGPSKPTSKRARANPKRPSGNVKLPKESTQSEAPSKTTSASEKPHTPEGGRSVSGNSLDVSSESKESSNSKDKSTARESVPSLDIIDGEEQSPCGLSSEGYSISNLSKSAEKSNPILDEIDQVLNNPVGKMNSSLEEREIIQEVSTPKVPIQAGSNQGTHIDPRIQFKEKLEETRAASVEKIKQSMKPLPPIPVIDLDGVGSEPEISNSVNKTVPQEKEKEDTPIQKARSESLQKILLKSAAEKMNRLMNQPLDMLQKDPYWNDELVKVTSCLVEQQFPEKYRKQVLCFGKIFENLFITWEKLSNVRLKVAMIQENSNGLIVAEKALREKEALYEKHLSNANDTLEVLSKTREDLVKKLAEIQAQIQEVDAKMAKLKKPSEKIQERKMELRNHLSEIEKNKLQNEADLKRLQEEELQELDLFKGFEDNKIQLKNTLEDFLQELGE